MWCSRSSGRGPVYRRARLAQRRCCCCALRTCGPCEPRAGASALCEAPLHLPPFGMRPHLIAGVAPQVEEAIGDRCQPDVRAPAIGTREAADGRMRLRALLPSVHVVLRIIGHVDACLEGLGAPRLTIRPSYTYSLGVIHHAGLERITRRV